MHCVQHHQISNLSYDEVTSISRNSIHGTIVLYHGWGSNISRQHFRAKILASFGYCVIIPEIEFHGKRGSCEYNKAESTLCFFEALNGAINEFEVLLDKVINQQQPIFLIGHSLGGLIALGCNQVYGNRINGIAAINSSALWPEDWTSMMQCIFSDAEQYDFTFMKDHTDLIDSIQKKNPCHWENNNIAPVLLTNGALDQTISKHYNENFLKEHQNLTISHVVIPDAGHVVTDGTLALCIDFFEKIVNQIVCAE